MAEPLEQVIKITGSTAEYERAVKRTTDLTEKLAEKIQKGSAVSAGSVAPIIQQHELLRREIVRVAGSIEAASPAMRAQYDQITAKVRGAVSETKQLTQVVQQQTTGFHSWGQVIEANSGKLGSFGSTAVGVSKNLFVLAAAMKVAKVEYDIWSERLFGGDDGPLDMIKKEYAKRDEAYRKESRGQRHEFWDTTYEFFGGRPDPDSGKNVPAAKLQYPLRPSDDQLLQSSAITSERLRKEAEAEKLKAEAAQKAAEAIDKLTISRRAELELMRTANPFEEAEIVYLRDLKLATFEATGELRKMAAEKAKLTRQGSIDTAFGALPHDILGGMMDKAPGVVDEGRAARDKFNFEMDIAEARGRIEDENDERQRQLDQKAADAQIQKWRDAHEQFTHDISDVFTDLAITGGENFGEMAAQRFEAMTRKGFDTLFAGIFGTPGDPDKKQDPLKLYTAKGVEMSPTAAKVSKAGQAALDMATIGVGAYGASRGGEGTRTGSIVGAAVSTFATTGNIYAAAAAAIVAAVGGFLGEQSRQAEYKYGVPIIGAGGDATLQRAKNMQPAEIEEIETRIQDKYDTIRNAYAKIFISAHENILDNLTRIDGKFQDNPSGNFMKHLDQWINGGLGDQIAGQVKGGLEKIFSTVGVGADRFNELWKKFDKLDPAKAAALFGELYTGMSKIQDAGKFFDRKNPWGMNTSFFSNMTDERKHMNRSAAQVMTQDYFTPILDVAKGINQLVGEEQIHAISEIARLQEQAKNAQIAAIQEIIRISDAATERKNNAFQNYDILKIQHGEGTDDEKRKREADLYKAALDDELRKIDSSKTAGEADIHAQRAQSYIDKIIGLGYDINEKTGNEWLNWAGDATSKIDAVLSKQLDDLGIEMSNANADFWAKFSALYDPFKAALEQVGDDIGGGNGDGDGFGTKVNDATIIVGGFSTALSAATTRLASFGGMSSAENSRGYSAHTASESATRRDRTAFVSGDESAILVQIRDLLADLVKWTALGADQGGVTAANTSGLIPTIMAALQQSAAASRSANFARQTAESRQW